MTPSKPVPPLIQHFENHLGLIVRGSLFKSAKVLDVQIIQFENQPLHGARTYSTLGLSKHLLGRGTNQVVRQELLLSVYDRFEKAYLDALLLVLVEDILAQHIAVSYGSVIGPKGPICQDSTLEAFCFMPPTMFPQSFATFLEGDSLIEIVWACPISPSEVNFIHNQGWPAFENKLKQMAPDLLDLSRKSIV